jgi:hypothetical protein
MLQAYKRKAWTGISIFLVADIAALELDAQASALRGMLKTAAISPTVAQAGLDIIERERAEVLSSAARRQRKNGADIIRVTFQFGSGGTLREFPTVASGLNFRHLKEDAASGLPGCRCSQPAQARVDRTRHRTVTVNIELWDAGPSSDAG